MEGFEKMEEMEEKKEVLPRKKKPQVSKKSSEKKYEVILVSKDYVVVKGEKCNVWSRKFNKLNTSVGDEISL